QPSWTELRDEHRDAERDRRRDKQRDDRRIQRAPDERQRAELPGHGIPDLGAPEREPELLNRRHRLAHELIPDRRHDQYEQGAKQAGPDSEGQVFAGHSPTAMTLSPSRARPSRA